LLWRHVPTNPPILNEVGKRPDAQSGHAAIRQNSRGPQKTLKTTPATAAERTCGPPPSARDGPGSGRKLGLEGIVSKQIDSQYSPGNRGIWVKIKCLNRAEFVIVGWTDPEGSRSSIGALLLGYFEKGQLKYAGRVGTGFSEKTLRMVHGKLAPLASLTPWNHGAYCNRVTSGCNVRGPRARRKYHAGQGRERE
jgi:hypothetical protein